MGANRGIRNVQIFLGVRIDYNHQQLKTALFKGQEQ